MSRNILYVGYNTGSIAVFDTRPAFTSNINAECRLLKTLPLIDATTSVVQVATVRGYLISTVTTPSSVMMLVHNTTSRMQADLMLNRTLEKHEQQQELTNVALIAVSKLNRLAYD